MPVFLAPVIAAAGVTGSIAIGTSTIAIAEILAYGITLAAPVGTTCLVPR